MQGLEKFSRAYADEQAETVRNVIEMAEIVALQEVGTQLQAPLSNEHSFFRDKILDVLPGRKLKAIGSFAFVYDSNKFSVVTCGIGSSETVVNCSFRVGKEKQVKKKRVYFACRTKRLQRSSLYITFI